MTDDWDWDRSGCYTDLKRLVHVGTGAVRYMCCLCFGHFAYDELADVGAEKTDVGQPCKAEEDRVEEERI